MSSDYMFSAVCAVFTVFLAQYTFITFFSSSAHTQSDYIPSDSVVCVLGTIFCTDEYAIFI